MLTFVGYERFQSNDDMDKVADFHRLERLKSNNEMGKNAGFLRLFKIPSLKIR